MYSKLSLFTFAFVLFNLVACSSLERRDDDKGRVQRDHLTRVEVLR